MLQKLALLTLVLLVVLGGIPGAQADDVPDTVRKWFDKAQSLYAKGDFKKALSAISKGKSKNPVSVDFWELYVRIWRGLEKKESILWDKVIAKAEKKIPGTTVFDMLRVRLATTSEERMTHLKAAIEKNPDAVAPRLLLAREHLRDGDDVTAEEILDEILEKEPGNEAALVTKGDLMIESGRSRSALNYAKESLGEHDLPGLHDLMARALLLIAENDAARLPDAKKEAEKAVAGRADPRFVVTLSTCLDREGEFAKALALLREHQAKANAPAIAVKLGEFELREGNYEKAVQGLGADRDPSYRVAKALLYAYAKLGEKKGFEQAVQKVNALAEDAEEEAAAIAMGYLGFGDVDAALKALEGIEVDGIDFTRAAVLAWKGDVAAVKDLAADKAKTGSRGGEEWMLHLARALLVQKLGGKTSSFLAWMGEGYHASARASIERAKVPEDEELPKANSIGFMQRYVSYRRTIGNRWFTPASPALNLDQEAARARLGVTGAAECPFEASRSFFFSDRKIEGGITRDTIVRLMQEMVGSEEEQRAWQGTAGAFAKGSKALVDGSWAESIEAFGEVLGAEPSWGRARLFLAVAMVMNGDAAGAAKEAQLAAEHVPDDWDGRELGLLIRFLAGEKAADELKALAERWEAYQPRRIEML